MWHQCSCVWVPSVATNVCEEYQMTCMCSYFIITILKKINKKNCKNNIITRSLFIEQITEHKHIQTPPLITIFCLIFLAVPESLAASFCLGKTSGREGHAGSSMGRGEAKRTKSDDAESKMTISVFILQSSHHCRNIYKKYFYMQMKVQSQKQ